MLYINRTMERTRRVINAPKRLIAMDEYEVQVKPKKKVPNQLKELWI